MEHILDKLNKQEAGRILHNFAVDEDGCWIPIGCENREEQSGYSVARIWNGSYHKMVKLHRLFYLELKGAIPDGLVIDHLCRNRACVNPTHLEAVTQKENVRRGLIARGITKKPTKPKIKREEGKCKQGHELSNNTYITKSGYVLCKTCRSVNNKRARQKRKGNV